MIHVNFTWICEGCKTKDFVSYSKYHRLEASLQTLQDRKVLFVLKHVSVYVQSQDVQLNVRSSYLCAVPWNYESRYLCFVQVTLLV